MLSNYAFAYGILFFLKPNLFLQFLSRIKIVIVILEMTFDYVYEMVVVANEWQRYMNKICDKI